MGVPKLKLKVSVEDYLAAEIPSPVRHEYVDGEVFAMAGSSDNHNLIAGEFVFALKSRLRGSRCKVFFNDIKVRVTSRIYYYPDILVSCEERPENPYFRNEPVLIIEITSPSTERVDRREKLLYYQSMPSLAEYVVADQDKMNVEVHRRQPNGGWLTYYFNEPTDVVELQSVNLTIPLPELYAQIQFQPNAGNHDDDED